MIKLLAAALLASALATPAADSCEVDAASLTWGFKESFRSYISSTIANGEWTVADGASYATPHFGFTDGTGTLAGGGGTVSFAGSIRFTGHGGILDTTLANPRLVFDSGNAILVLDVTGTTQAGDPVDSAGVEFATIDLSGVRADSASSDSASAGSVSQFSVEAAPAALTAEGAAAFGTYEAGEELDPVTFTLDIDSACAAALTARPAGLEWLWWSAGAILAAAGVAAVLLARRRRAPRPQAPGA